MTARMDPRTGLLPGQSWSVAPGPTWQARIGRDGRAHCIGRTMAEHADYAAGYLDPGRVLAGVVRHTIVADMHYAGLRVPRQLRPRPWHTFDRACRAARMHSRMVIAAKRNAAQAGQGEG